MRIAEIGKRLTAMREALGLSQAQVCRDIGVAPNTWNQYEKGKNEIPPQTAVKLRRKYGITTDWIYDGDRTMLPAAIDRKINQLPAEKDAASPSPEGAAEESRARRVSPPSAAQITVHETYPEDYRVQWEDA